jgi:hypothetical protein
VNRDADVNPGVRSPAARGLKLRSYSGIVPWYSYSECMTERFVRLGSLISI